MAKFKINTTRDHFEWEGRREREKEKETEREITEARGRLNLSELDVKKP